MNPSYLKDLLLLGREVEFEYGMNRYVVKKIDFHSTTEFSFGPKTGSKITSEYFDLLLYRRDFGSSLYEMLEETQFVYTY